MTFWKTAQYQRLNTKDEQQLLTVHTDCNPIHKVLHK